MDIDQNSESKIKNVDLQENSEQTKLPDVIALLPLKNTVIFPEVAIPITINRDSSLQLLREAYSKDRIIGTIAQKDSKIDNPGSEDVYSIGTIAVIFKIFQMPDESTTVIIRAIKKFKIKEFTKTSPYLEASIEELDDLKNDASESEFNAVISTLKEQALQIIQLSQHIPSEASFAVKNIEDPSFLVNFIATSTEIDIAEKQSLLEIDNIKERTYKLSSLLSVEIQKLQLKDEIQGKLRMELDKQQKEYILNEQIKTIQNELGRESYTREIEELAKSAKEKKWGKAVQEVFDKELRRLERMNPAAPDYSMQTTYLQTLLELPWGIYTKDRLDLRVSQKTLDQDHYGLDKAKERIIEYLAVLKLKGDLKSPIICLYGPPGVGKTSLGKSVAKAMKRKYIRMSLGGLHDEAEIRGHRRTYIGAMPGRIIQNLKKAKSSNPVFILDEIDKIGTDFRGDPSFALLEVLDPEQNNTFYDNYLELEYDLSKVMFIATANSLNTINPALLDRMELIHVSGYIVEEKIEIARRHLIPKQLKAHGVKKTQLQFPDDSIEEIIENYTRESGVRDLDKKITRIIRNVARKIGLDEKYNIVLNKEDLRKILGPPKFLKEKYQDNQYAGVVVGLAWTAVGGSILFVETSLSRGKGGLTLTGNLGEVMKESAVLALEYIKAHANQLDLDHRIFENWNIHIHIPEGATPKDGPSAGITLATSLASAFTQRKVRSNLAMTGEITLRGKVLPVGGIKEKILAAKRSGITHIILSEDNRNDIEGIKKIYLKDIEFIFVSEIIEVFQHALTDQKVEKPIDLTSFNAS